ncbi:MAG: cupin domain-containing protein [Gaiellaceae bacterium]
MTAFSDANELDVIRIWDGVHARTVAGEHATLAHIELAPNAVVPEHQHVNEQTGPLLRGSLTFTIAGETKELGPGAMWVIRSDVPHAVTAGPAGATLAELFSPPRDDWAGLERLAAAPVTLG